MSGLTRGQRTFKFADGQARQARTRRCLDDNAMYPAGLLLKQDKSGRGRCRTSWSDGDGGDRVRVATADALSLQDRSRGWSCSRRGRTKSIQPSWAALETGGLYQRRRGGRRRPDSGQSLRSGGSGEVETSSNLLGEGVGVADFEHVVEVELRALVGLLVIEAALEPAQAAHHGNHRHYL